MLTPHDITMMENDVRNTIAEWNTTITIIKPKPIEQQTHWNPLLHEYSGPVLYDITNNVPAERKDAQNMQMYTTDIDNSAGNKNDGFILFAVSDLVDVNTDCVIKYNNDFWRIDSIRTRIGEFLLTIIRYSGDTRWGDIIA